MESYVVYDIETYSRAYSDLITIAECNCISVVVTYVPSEGIKVWFENEIEELVKYLLSYDILVGFNNKYYDNSIINNYLPGSSDELNKKSFDILEYVEGVIGTRVSLDSIAQATLNKKKVGNGEDAIKWWYQRKRDLVINYCREDVLITNEIYQFLKKNNYLYYNKFGVSKKIFFEYENPTPPLKESFQFIDDNGIEINLDPQNKEFFYAIELVKKTNDIIYLTGKAGTGKTTFLKYLSKSIGKKTAVVAPTGVAAINAGGQSIHSFFTINFNEPPFIPNDIRLRFKSGPNDVDKTTIYSHFRFSKARLELFRSLELLIIDEISMVRADLLDVIDRLLRAYCGRGRNKPFGGVQVIMIGDVFQLPPVEGKDWKEVLYRFYDGPFFFNSLVLKEIKPIYIELKTIYRQKETHFIDLLNRVRRNQPSIEDLSVLNKRVKPVKYSSFHEKYIALCSKNEPAQEINQKMLQRLAGREFSYEASLVGKFADFNYPVEYNLKLKVGAQIMFVKNSHDYFNGKIGKIEKLEEGFIIVSITNNLGEKKYVTVTKYTWQNVSFKLNEDRNKIEQEILGSFTQYPIKLAWAITIHKSQGLTFEHVLINIEDWTTSGLVYVALSRCVSLNNIILQRAIRREQIKTDDRVIKFADTEATEELIEDRISRGHADASYRLARREFKNKNYNVAFNYFVDGLTRRDDLDTQIFETLVPYFQKEIELNKKLFVALIKKSKKLIGRDDLKIKLVKILNTKNIIKRDVELSSLKKIKRVKNKSKSKTKKSKKKKLKEDNYAWRVDSID